MPTNPRYAACTILGGKCRLGIKGEMRFEGFEHGGKDWVEVGMGVSVRRAEDRALWVRLSRSQGAVSDSQRANEINATD